MRTGPTLIVAALALGAGGFAGYRLALTKPEAAVSPVAPQGDMLRGAVDGNNAAKKLLYYRNPMGLPDTSPVPKKDPMGMDYLPVYEGETDGDSGLKISVEKIQKLGVKSEPAKRQVLDKSVRASGRVEIDESRTYTVTAKFEGYIERLYVNTSGQPVGRGQPLFEVYSPELVSVQREYAIAAQGVGQLSEAGGEAQGAMRQLAESSLQRLKNWDVSEEQVKALAKSGETKRTLTFRSPVAGVVTEKAGVQDGAKKLWNGSNQAKKGENGRTESGLYRFFMTAKRAKNFDIYGFPNVEKTLKEILQDRETVKDNQRSLFARTRKEPLTIDEAFSIDADSCIFNSINIAAA